MPEEIIQYDDFLKLDLRVGTITAAEAHPNADKLLVLQVDLGPEQRQLVAGIRAHYEPAQLVGKQIIVVANLAPRMMRGLESKGMLLAASTPDKSQVVLLTTEKPVPPGSTVS
ncbi:MAG: methionine--tRNA ligase subunit beta [Phycisphaerae bacterium]|jgi:methionyl-tRNA synthetase|nr:methionine--tRNA ligase subunit beta [Phycisphaerae bacterium]